VNILVIHMLGDAISPLVIGAVADRTAMAMGFGLISVMMAVGGALWVWGARDLDRDTAAVSPDPVRQV